jgi:hypothetical protein
MWTFFALFGFDHQKLEKLKKTKKVEYYSYFVTSD